MEATVAVNGAVCSVEVDGAPRPVEEGGGIMVHRKSSYDRINQQMKDNGWRKRVPPELREDLVMVVRRAEGAGVELSPFLRSMADLSDVPVKRLPAMRAVAVAGV